MYERVHSGSRTDMEKGKRLAEVLLACSDLDITQKRDLIYLIALADKKLGKVIGAREQLRALLEVNCLLGTIYFLLEDGHSLRLQIPHESFRGFMGCGTVQGLNLQKIYSRDLDRNVNSVSHCFS